ncbi:GDSL esterase/lipase At5g03610-like isoform X2 [Prosopis cineraria]|uniref:GDSL esterase/lipase At5g03610-like isoform X2 n=1 Tax=Prosopis cineraria TaxID=364024 RepID=UPI00240F8C03|nr:GDSL esterase/lipase At5g03610-like isoform X2 [Prosopis cineraria]
MSFSLTKFASDSNPRAAASSPMGSHSHHLSILSLLLFMFVSVSEQTRTAVQSKQGIHHKHNFRPTSIFVFGDSYADTGNSLKGKSSAWKAPYGTTYPGKPAGRFSDGRVLTDFVGEGVDAATYLGLKSPEPFGTRKTMAENVKRGMNFAFGGAGVFDADIGAPNVSTQIDNLEQMIKHKVYTSEDLTNSVALVSVAGNDYAHYVATSGSFEGLPSFIASVVNQTSWDLMRIHELGVKRIVVSALQPLGCLPVITYFFSLNRCYDAFNTFAILHNRLLNQSLLRLNRITRRHNQYSPTFLLLDLYAAFTSVLSHPSTYNIPQLFKPCCLGANSSYSCASVDDNHVKRYSVCDNPKSALFWDSVHPSDAGWHAVYTKLRTLRSFQQLRTIP